VIPGDALVIVPIRNVVLFPGMILPLTIAASSRSWPRSRRSRPSEPVGHLLQRERRGRGAGSGRSLPGRYGGQHPALRDPARTTLHVIVCQGLQRFRVVEYLPGYPFPVARIARIDEAEATDSQIEARMIQLRERALEVLQYLPQVSQELLAAVKSIAQAGALADLVASVTELKLSRPAARPRDALTCSGGSTSCSTACSGASRCCAFRASSTSAPRRASTSASANTCCASS
jgi:ATP-dependent Lon protease